MQDAANSKIEKFHHINKIQIMKQEGLEPRAHYKSTVLIPKKTLDNIKKGPEEAQKIDYEQFKAFIEKHKNALFKPNQKYTLAMLTEGGWRNGDAFVGTDFNYYDPILRYKDKDTQDEIEFVFAVQIIAM